MNATLTEVMHANDAFYRVFLRGDADALIALLADRPDLEVMHPGWPTVRGRALVVATWRDVAANPPPLRVVAPRVLPLGPDAAVVTCYEHIDDTTTLIATNVWVREDAGWRLLHHQAAPSVREEDVAVPPPDDLFH